MSPIVDPPIPSPGWHYDSGRPEGGVQRLAEAGANLSDFVLADGEVNLARQVWWVEELEAHAQNGRAFPARTAIATDTLLGAIRDRIRVCYATRMSAVEAAAIRMNKIRDRISAEIAQLQQENGS